MGAEAGDGVGWVSKGSKGLRFGPGGGVWDGWDFWFVWAWVNTYLTVVEDCHGGKNISNHLKKSQVTQGGASPFDELPSTMLRVCDRAGR